MTKLNGKSPVKFADHIPTTATLIKGQIAHDINGDIYTSTAENYGGNGTIHKLTNCKCASASSATVLLGAIEYIEEVPIGTDKIFTTSQAYLPNTLELYISGLRQLRNIDYIETGTNTFEVSEEIENLQVFVKYAVITKTQMIIEEVPIGENKIFHTSQAYLPNTLELYISGLRQLRDIDYIETSENTFEVSEEIGNLQVVVKYISYND